VIDTVHGQVSDARMATVHAEEEMEKARGHKKDASNKYKYFIGCSCLLIILVTILIGGFASKSF
jgi:t-SNARE complex subunit (syntaxin)